MYVGSALLVQIKQAQIKQAQIKQVQIKQAQIKQTKGCIRHRKRTEASWVSKRATEGQSHRVTMLFNRLRVTMLFYCLRVFSGIHFN